MINPEIRPNLSPLLGFYIYFSVSNKDNIDYAKYSHILTPVLVNGAINL